MSTFLHHTNCPKCGSRDNNAVFDDGHEWCFGCGYYKPPTTNLQTVTKHFSVPVTKGLQSLPDDCVQDIPKEPYAWLKQYSLTNEELFKNNLLWSAKEEMLIFPYYADGVLLCWQGRFFPTRKQKVTTKGRPEEHILLQYCNIPNGIVVVVEDSVSAIKVSRVCDSMVLWGSYLSPHKARWLASHYDNLVLWLDGDKTKEMIKFSHRYGHLFKSVRVISRAKDPKEHSIEEMQEILLT